MADEDSSVQVAFRCIALLSMLFAAACSPLEILDLAVPGRGYTVEQDIAYGASPRQRLDVYVPDPAAFPGPRPVLFFLYGGAWQDGDRRPYRFVGEAFATRGFVVVIPDYRVYPEVSYPEFVRDAAAAFAWTYRHIAARHGDPGHLVVAGHSAGAHIGAMLAFNERFLRETGLDRSAVHAFVGLAGPYDFRPSAPGIQGALSGEGDTDRAMPTRYVHGGEPPSLLLIGDEDRRVSPVNQQKLTAALRAHGDAVDARTLPGLGHATILARLAAPIRDESLVDTIATFAAR